MARIFAGFCLRCKGNREVSYSLVRMQSLLEKLDVDAPVRRHHAVAPVVHVIAQVMEDRLARTRLDACAQILFAE
jgi:hypothetical protein